MRIISRQTCLLLLAASCCLFGCASTSQFDELAKIDKKPASEQAALTLSFDAYVIGIEKDNASRVGTIVECALAATGDCLNINAPFFERHPELQQNLQAKYSNQFRPTFVSHIARFSSADGLCFLHNVHAMTRRCAEVSAGAVDSGTVAASWKALATLGVDIRRYVAARKPTHVIVYTMGWNTSQPEAIGNFRDLTRQLMSAAAERSAAAPFRPLIIGVTWPSTGTPLIPASDYGIKAKDADEVGALWENVLINRELATLKGEAGFRLIVIGHSFGARASSRAVFSGPLLTSSARKSVDLLIGLQGAYSFQRFRGAVTEDDPSEGTEGGPYRDFASVVGKVVLTSSTFDEAVLKVGHGPYFVGSNQVFAKTSKPPLTSTFSHGTASPDGTLADVVCNDGKVLMVDASNVIKGNHPGTSGGAHSVIYTPEIGRMTWQLIRSCAL